MNFRYKLMRFMQGRNGVDYLGKATLVAYLVLWFVNIILRSKIVSILLLGLLIYAMFRILSTDLYARRQENYKFFDFMNLQKEKFRLRKTKYFHKCPHCKAILRLPRKKGRHNVCCPKCKQNSKVTIIF